MSKASVNTGQYLLSGLKYADILKKTIEKLGIQPVFIPDNPYIDDRLSGHVDLSVFYPGGKDIFLAPFLKDSKTADIIRKIGLNPVYANIKQGKKYPFDAQMNACAWENYLIYSENVTAGEIIEYFKNKKGRLISCRQGYLNCSVCKVDNNSIITADRGVYDSCTAAGLDVLLINPGFIELPGYDYGFLGGSSFKISDNKIAFTGSLKNHPDEKKILEFLKSKNQEAVFLTDEAIFDIGGAILI